MHGAVRCAGHGARLAALALVVVACSPSAPAGGVDARGETRSVAPGELPKPRDATLELLVLSTRAAGDASESCELILNLAFDAQAAFGFGGDGDYWTVRAERSERGSLAGSLRHVGKQWSGPLPPPDSMRGRRLAPRAGLGEERIRDAIATLDGLFATVSHQEARGPSSCSYARRLLDALGIAAPELDVRPAGWDWVPPKPH
jgi:hypothetical protein